MKRRTDVPHRTDVREGTDVNRRRLDDIGKIMETRVKDVEEIRCMVEQLVYVVQYMEELRDEIARLEVESGTDETGEG